VGQLIKEDYFNISHLSIDDLSCESTIQAQVANTFLAHSSLDKFLFDKVFRYLERYGAKLYVDKNDMELPVTTSVKTAELLKDNIIECEKFIVLMTENTMDSKWVPWELGVADKKENFDNIAILLMNSSSIDTDYLGNEYVGLYQSIIEEGDDLIIYNPKTNKKISLLDWFYGDEILVG
jgi:hypothetical protein